MFVVVFVDVVVGVFVILIVVFEQPKPPLHLVKLCFVAVIDFVVVSTFYFFFIVIIIFVANVVVFFFSSAVDVAAILVTFIFIPLNVVEKVVVEQASTMDRVMGVVGGEWLVAILHGDVSRYHRPDLLLARPSLVAVSAAALTAIQLKMFNVWRVFEEKKFEDEKRKNSQDENEQ